jgi:hypothetical protein
MPKDLPPNLDRLHTAEEGRRAQARLLIAGDARLQLHLAITEAAMEMADITRQFHTSDEDLKVVQILAMRTFNAFAAALKLMLSGYHQNSALILRDVLETAFLLDLFNGDRSAIERWRFADKKSRKEEFAPLKVRIALDARDDNTSNKRSEMYEMFSVLAGHPNMNSHLMMRPEKGGDAVSGPFMELTTLQAGVFEMGRLAVQVGESLDAFLPTGWCASSRDKFGRLKREWAGTFYPNVVKPAR